MIVRSGSCRVSRCRLHAGAKEAAVLQELLDRPAAASARAGGGVAPNRSVMWRRRSPSDRPSIAAEVDALDDMDRNQVVAEGDAGRRGVRRAPATFGESTEAEQVGDRLAHLGHRRAARPAGSRRGRRAPARRRSPALRSRPDATPRSGPAYRLCGAWLRVGEGGRRHRNDAGQESDDGGSRSEGCPHAKVYREGAVLVRGRRPTTRDRCGRTRRR